MLEHAIRQWSALADEAERAVSFGLLEPKTGAAQVDVYRRTVKALEIERETGVAVCSCCHKPVGRGTKFLDWSEDDE